MLTAEQLAALERAEQLAGLTTADRVVSAHDPADIRYPAHGLIAIVRDTWAEIMEPLESPRGRCAVSVAVRGSEARVGNGPAPDGYEKVNQWFIDQQSGGVK